MTKRRGSVKVGEGIVVAISLWFLGWLIYDFVALWQMMSPFEYRNMLLMLMALTVLASVEWARRSEMGKLSQPTTIEKTSSKHRANNPKSQSMPEWAEKLYESHRELSSKVADLHALGQIRQKRQEADK